MRKFKAFLTGISLLCCSLLTANVFAQSCGTPSPNVQAVNDAWAPVPSQQLSPDELGRVFAFLSGIVGTWEGNGEATECFPTGETFEARQTPQTLKLSIEHNEEGQFSFNVDVFDTQNKIRTMYGFVIVKTEQGLQLAGEGNLALVNASDNVLKFRTQTLLVRMSANPNLRTSLETLRALSLQNGELRLSKAEFHNGVLINFSDWVFSKR